jgi:hypothetical protein
MVMVFNDTINNISAISWRSDLLVEETGEPGENNRPAIGHWQTLSHNVVSSTPHHERDSNSEREVVIDTNCIGSCNSNYHDCPSLYFNNILYPCVQDVDACVYNLPKAGVVGEIVSLSML